jgi:hypothetical protein
MGTSPDRSVRLTGSAASRVIRNKNRNGRTYSTACEEDDMFGPITLPFGAKMLFNTVRLKPNVTFEDVELAVGELCSVVKETYGGDKGGFVAGQVFKFSGFVSNEGSLTESKTADDHYVIVTYWRSFEDHERSHANEIFANKFAALAVMCSDTKELGYDMLWQGAAGSR